jgi:multidrug efflux system membrane fusion protein
VQERLVRQLHEFSARIEAVDKVELRPRISGYIESVNFKPGALVRKGDTLFVIDPRPFAAEAARAEAAMRAAAAKAELAQTELARARKLAADQAIARRELDEKAAAARELDALAQSARAAYDAARLNLAFTRVTSPISGRVGKAEVTVGNLVDSGVMLTTVVTADPLYASFEVGQDVFMELAPQARSGKSIAVRIADATSGEAREGALEFVDNEVDPATGTARMRARLGNQAGQLAPGMFARVKVGADEGGQKRALVIAEGAIGTDQDRKFVYVVTAQGKAEYRRVKLGPAVGQLRVVREGLAPGERIVVTGLQRVRPGAPVTPQPVAMEPAAAPAAQS